ncbi:MAG TPA: O-antigen ligase family protein, partial [Anaerovoracaceae bacterium]|nr:O-antigen ligase family protein [Anaerovoracaceae bacterium]
MSKFKSKGAGRKKATAKQTKNISSPTDTLQIGLPDGSRFELALASFFTSFIILLMRMYVYERPMDQFYWSVGNEQLIEFFSYYKMVFILISAVLALLVILYRITTSTFYVRKNNLYILMAVYTLFVFLSYLFSDYKEFSLLGFNERFEGTLVQISYMVMLYFIYNIVTNERSLKWMLYILGASSVLLGLLGISQYTGHDFLRTTIGKKIYTPSIYWDQLDTITFTFQNKEIYQTVYNINYVSFYITLLIPIFALLFIGVKNLKGKVAWGILFFLAIFNLVGSKSSGGFLGLGVVFIVALILLNKRILQWKKPILILLAMTLIAGGLTYEVWTKEISHSFKGMAKDDPPINIESFEIIASDKVDPDKTPGTKRPYIDYIETGEDNIVLSLNGEPLTIKIHASEGDEPAYMALTDKKQDPILIAPTGDEDVYSIMDNRFYDYATLSYGSSDDFNFIMVNTPETEWTFVVGDEIGYINPAGKAVRLSKVPAVGWKDNQSFGSGRGYIWSRTLPMLKETLLLGHGADTYVLHFPHDDYAGKYNAKWKLNKIVDKPHNMYVGMAVGTGAI